MGRHTAPYRDKRTDGWRFAFQGKRYYRKSEAEAWQLLATLKGKAERPTDGPPVHVAELMQRWASEREATRGKPPTFALTMLRDFAEFAKLTPLSDLPASILFDYLAALRGRQTRNRCGTPHALGPETLRKEVAHASALLGWAHRRGFIATRPECPTVKPPPFKPHALSEAERVALLTALTGKDRDRSILTLVKFLLETGLRPGEARKLEWCDVDLGRRVVTIPTHKAIGRQTRPRAKVVALSPAASAILIDLPEREGWVFRTNRHTPYTARGLESILRRHGCPIYRLRHTWCQAAADAGVAPHVISELMGHGGTDMIRHYCRVADASLHAAVAATNGLGTLPVVGKA